ncbi:MAG: DUF1624 domain-containing protein [Burkholderiales bacterium]|nr:DUF1624 domain-containing protein [Burkholderiales bacterium]
MTGRFDRLDSLRGIALVWMAVFHFCFDLSHNGLLVADFYNDVLWTTQRTCILSLFLLCAGAGQAVATAQGQSWPRFWRRWAQIMACAALVTVGSFWMFPTSFIYFGVLHGMAVMLVLARLSAPLGRWLWPLGALAIAAPFWVQHPFFDHRGTNWVGLVTHKPITEDYVPILPWLGVMWWGLAGTQWLLSHHPAWLQSKPRSSDNEGWMPASRVRTRRALAGLGRWSLSFYMLHQPILIGPLSAWMWLTGRPVP